VHVYLRLTVAASSKEKISTEASPSIGAAGKEGATTGKKQAARKQERQPEVGFFLFSLSSINPH